MISFQIFKQLDILKCPPKPQSSLCYSKKSLYDYLSIFLCCNRKDLGLDRVSILNSHNKPSIMRLHEVKA